MTKSKRLEALRGGDRIFVTKSNRPDHHKCYALVQSGCSIRPEQFQKLLPVLKAVPDGLFGTDDAQTFEIAE